MGDTKNLTYQEAIDKIKELAEGNTCLFCTYTNNEIESRPMAAMSVDDDGAIWFFSRKDSMKNMQINENDKVYLMFLNEGKEHYLSLKGHAEVVYDKQKIEEVWKPIVKAWFEKGKDDPQLSLIKVKPEDGHYWDTKNGKVVSMIKIATAVLTGKSMDGGVEGDIDL